MGYDGPADADDSPDPGAKPDTDNDANYSGPTPGTTGTNDDASDSFGGDDSAGGFGDDSDGGYGGDSDGGGDSSDGGDGGE